MKYFLIVDLLEDLGAELELDRVAELGQVAAEDQEVGRRVHRLDLLDRPHRLLDEAGVDVLRIEVGVRDPGEPEGLGGTAGRGEGLSRVLIRGNQPATTAPAALPASSARLRKSGASS